MADQYEQIADGVADALKQDQFDLDDVKITHVENLFIISYLTKALQDVLIQRVKFLQYPLLLVDLPLAFAILIVNVERFLYVKIVGYVLAHIQFDVSVLKSLVQSQAQGPVIEGESWGERIFELIRKGLRFLWGLIILLFILPVWPVIWIYNYFIQTILIMVIYYFLIFFDYGFFGGMLVYYLLFMTVTFLVSSITVPFLFRLSVYVREMFSLEKKSWKQINRESHLAFLQFYKRLQGGDVASEDLQINYEENIQVEGGVYYMILKFLHYLKDKFWKLKEKKVDAVVEKIQSKTVEIVDEYYSKKTTYQQALQSLSGRDLRRTVFALGATFLFCLLLVMRGAQGQGLIGPLLISFVDREVSELIWVNQANSGLGYYQHMIDSYSFFPQILSLVAALVDWILQFFYMGFHAFYPLYLTFIWEYYRLYFNVLIVGLFWDE